MEVNTGLPWEGNITYLNISQYLVNIGGMFDLKLKIILFNIRKHEFQPIFKFIY